MKQANKCKECGKILREYNKSGFCGHHYKMDYFRKKRVEWRKGGKCISCGKDVLHTRKVNQETKIHSRCDKCRERTRKYYFRKKKEKIIWLIDMKLKL